MRGRKAYVAAPFPGKKKTDRSVHIWDNGDDIGIKVFRDNVDEIALKDHYRRLFGMPAWQPRRRKPRKPKAVPFAVRNHFFGETLAVCRFRKKITPDQFALLINDLRLRGDARDAIKYVREFGLPMSDLEQCMRATPRHYTADERAKILNLTYAERQHLGLRRTGSIDLDKAGRERARRDRYNEKRRAIRAGARRAGVNKTSQVQGRLPKKKVEVKSSTIRIVSMDDYREDRPKEQPLPAIPHEQLAEMRLLDELGDGDPDRGVRIAIAMGDAKFCWLRRELMRGSLYPSTIRAAARGRRHAA
ncbi:hypothetical protein [Nitrobacter sp. Nb-311A]|uniref:hypothetical protein n=1 Tax=Nitrobacter sp. Nb-311A TaxID=314253 RepID=UPI0003252A04|nr:hypothetical protein [Nitrobacter sp. Nb-311A]